MKTIVSREALRSLATFKALPEAGRANRMRDLKDSVRLGIKTARLVLAIMDEDLCTSVEICKECMVSIDELNQLVTYVGENNLWLNPLKATA